MLDRDAEVERICQAALDCPSEARRDLVARECRGDESLVREVEELLALDAVAGPFLETHALVLQSRLGPYEVLSVLGIGGMGEVYRARDTVLGRDVALKVLPRPLDRDPELAARLQREARALASLNHPNIAQIYGVEQGALVMELVDGATLKTPLPIATALDYAGQIAAALEAAHEKGVVHRDLKPSNIVVTPDGTVKVLDFGLAALHGEAAGQASGSPAPAAASDAVTRGGAILGTAPYMSPEQASGRPVDKRTDIWSFGVVVWEMLLGRRLFGGATMAETLARVQSAPIDMRQVPGETPAAIRELLSRCLDRDPRTRLRDIGEARILIHKARSGTPARAAIPSGRLLRIVAWTGCGLAVVFAALFAMERRAARGNDAPLPLTFHVPAPPQTTFSSGPALSPDGRHVAFTAKGADGRVRIWVHPLDTGKARQLPGTEDAFSPLFWSPDSRFVGFAAGTTLSRIALTGGPPVALCDRCGPASIGSRVFRGGTWSAAGVIVYAISSDGLWRIPDAGGTPARVTPAGDYGYPAFLPDGERLLYTWFGRNPQPGLYVADLRRTEPQPARRLLDGAFVQGRYAPRPGKGDGFLVAVREGVVTARPFDAATLTVTGEPTVIAQDVPSVEPPAAFSTSSTGALAFSTSSTADRSQLLWMDRRGRVVGQLGPASYGTNVSISPDGTQIAFDTTEPDRRTRHIWMADPLRGVATLVNTGARDWTPMVSSSGDVAFSSAPDLYRTRSSAIGSPEPLFRSPNPKLPNDWSPDGRFLVFNERHPTRRADLYLLAIDGRKQIPLVVTDADEWPATFSPDGRWIAYSSDETGAREVYVRDFAPDRIPAVGSVKIRVSTSGGDKPRWRRDGGELYYVSPDKRLMAVPVTPTPAFGVGLPIALFDVRLPTTGFPFDVARDGRFLVNTLDAPEGDASGSLTVVLNWAR